jgi:hypothetical protein
MVDRPGRQTTHIRLGILFLHQKNIFSGEKTLLDEKGAMSNN